MARNHRRAGVSRRKFLSGVAVAGASVAPAAAGAATGGSAAASPTPSALPPTWKVAAAETGTPKELARGRHRDGSDFMVDVIKSLISNTSPPTRHRASAACTSR
jgi:hypothetical protein